MNQLKLVMKGGEALTFENVIPWKGESFWFLNQMYPIWDEKGRMIAVGLIARNITERKQVEEEVWRHNEELTALNAIAIMVNSSLDLQQILDQTLDKVLEITKMEVGSLYLTDPQTEELVLSTYKGSSKEFADQVRTFKLGENIVGLAAQSGKPIVADDLTGDPRVTTTLVSGEGIRSLAAIPMKSKNKVQGMINMASYTCHSFTNEEIDFYTAIANQIGVAIENARLYEAVQRELTERKRAEEALRKSEEKYRTVADFTYDWEYWVGLDRNFIYISPSCERVTGYRPEEFFANPNLILTIVHPDDRRMIAQHNNDLFDREEVDHLEFRINTRSGEELWISHICQPVYSNDGSFLGRRGNNRDITVRKRAEEALRESEGTARALMDSPVDSVLVVNPDGIILDTNQTFAQRIGRRVDELIGRCVYDFFPPELVKSRRARVDEIVHFGVPIRFEDERAGIQLDHSAHPICDAQGKVTKIAIVARDITERKRIEKSLMESERKLRLITENMRDTVFAYDLERRLQYVNSAFEILTGYTCQELYERNFINYIHPEDEARMLQLWEELFHGKAIVDEGFRIITKEGRTKWCSSSWGPLFDEKGKQVGVQGRETDITERKRAEESLRRAEENFRRSLDESPLGVRIVSVNGETLYANRAILEIYGYDSIEELGTTPVKKRYTPESYAEFQIRKKKRQRGEYDPPEYEISIVRKNGEVRHLQVFRKEVLWNGEKQYQAIYLDITERKWAEEALQASKELFEKTFVSQLDAIFLLDAINPPTILDCNPAATEIFGYTRQEMVGRTTDFLHVDETTLKEFQRHLYPTLFERGFLHQFKFQMRRKDGAIFHTEHSVTQLKDEQDKGIGWVSVIRDITERKWAEERVLTYQEQLRSLTSELSLIEERERRYIATELHDNISQTLAIAKIKLGMAQEVTSSTDWVGSLNEIGELVDEAIQYTRSLTFELSPPILYELGFEAAAEWLTEQIQEQHHIEIGFEDDRRSKPMSEEIRIALFKATKELLINIVKHAQASKAKVSIWREDHSIRIRVEDDGVGFSTSEGKQLRKTTGFGLFNIRERMKYLGGDMVIESEPGRGTRVTLSAPLEEKED